jgi:hypothetical protein
MDLRYHVSLTGNFMLLAQGWVTQEFIYSCSWRCN